MSGDLIRHQPLLQTPSKLTSVPSGKVASLRPWTPVARSLVSSWGDVKYRHVPANHVGGLRRLRDVGRSGSGGRWRCSGPAKDDGDDALFSSLVAEHADAEVLIRAVVDRAHLLRHEFFGRLIRGIGGHRIRLGVALVAVGIDVNVGRHPIWRSAAPRLRGRSCTPTPGRSIERASR